jgi:hypothetical protein
VHLAGWTEVVVAALAVAGYWVVDSAKGPTFGETLKALDKTGVQTTAIRKANGFVSTQTRANYSATTSWPQTCNT